MAATLMDVLSTIMDVLRGAKTEIVVFFIALCTHRMLFASYNAPKRQQKSGKEFLSSKGDQFKGYARATYPQNRKGADGDKVSEEEARQLAPIKAAASKGNLEEAEAAFRSCATRGTLQYNTLMDACVTCRNSSTARRIIAEAVDEDSADVYTFHSLMKVYLNSGDLKRAREAICESRKKGFAPTCTMFNELLDATVVRNVDGCWDILDDMRIANVNPNKVTCSILLKGVQQASKSSLLDKALSLVDVMEEEMDEVLLSSIIEACIRTGRTNLLAATLQRQQGNKRVQVHSSHAYGSLIRAYGVMQDVANVWATWREMQMRHVEMTSITIGCMVESLVTNTSPEDGYELIREVASDPRTSGLLNAVIYGSVLKGFSHQKQFDRMWAVYKEMLQNGIQLTIATYNTLVDACARCNTMHCVSGLLEEMVGSGIEPNTITYSAIIKGYCQENRIELALDVLKEMKNRKELAPDEHTYNTVINGCARLGLYDKGLAILEEMCEAGIAPSNFTLSVVVKLASRGRRVDKAFELCENLSKKFNLRPNVHVYNNLVQACIVHKGFAAALDVVARMLGQGVRLDVRTYSLLLRACLDTQQAQEAAGLVCAATGLKGAHPRFAGVPSKLVQPHGGLPCDLLNETLEGIARRCRNQAIAEGLFRELRAMPNCRGLKFSPRLH